MNFSQNLKALRENQGLKQYEVSLSLNLPRVTYTCYEIGTREPNFKTLCALADYFGVTTDQLLGRAPLPDENVGKEVTKLEKGLTRRLEECLLAFVERVSRGEATTEAEVQALPAVSQVLVNLQNIQMNPRLDLDNKSTIPHLQQLLKEERKRDHSHT